LFHRSFHRLKRSSDSGIHVLNSVKSATSPPNPIQHHKQQSQKQGIAIMR